jgi:phosphoenolpyruvate---glycerone phosphotransferase subunit DhaL
VAITVDSAAAWMATFADVVHAQAGYLTELDSAIGDADHGANLDRGMKAVAALDPAGFDSASAYLKKAGMTLVSTVGGASGPLYGTLLLRLGGALPVDGEVTAASLGDALQAGLDGILQRGHAEVGDKTMVDALTPAVAAYRAAEGGGVGPALAASAAACALGRDATLPLVARKGRASYLGERSAGHLDPGAASVTMLLEAAANAWGG